MPKYETSPRREAGGKWQNALFRATRRPHRGWEKVHNLKGLASKGGLHAREGWRKWNRPITRNATKTKASAT